MISEIRCSVDDCMKPARSRGWCVKHYARWYRHGDPHHHQYGETLADRIWSKVDPSGDCWEWTGASNDQGYGHIYRNGRVEYAHRVVWEELVGPIPVGLQIDHLCRNGLCVNPDHLEPVTHAENLARGSNAGARKTHCIRGHPFAGDNLYRYPSGQRGCRQCRRYHHQKHAAKQRGAAQ